MTARSGFCDVQPIGRLSPEIPGRGGQVGAPPGFTEGLVSGEALLLLPLSTILPGPGAGSTVRGVTPCSYTTHASYGTIHPRCSESRKGGDMACIRGPLGAILIISSYI
jgi:hypothetical protein